MPDFGGMNGNHPSPLTLHRSNQQILISWRFSMVFSPSDPACSLSDPFRFLIISRKFPAMTSIPSRGSET